MKTQIKAEELRINNWVFNEYTRQPQQTYPMMIAQIASLEKEGKEVMMSGLPITEELLLKAGFIKDGVLSFDKWSHPDNGHQLVPRADGIWVYRVPGVSLVDIRYIHQLQNIFYWLSGGKELTL